MQTTPQYWIRPGAAVLYVPNYVSKSDADTLYDRVLTECTWQQGALSLFGKSVLEPRLTAWCGDVAYTYSRRPLLPSPWVAGLAELRAQLHVHLPSWLGYTAELNHALINRYRDGSDGMGWHRDNEPELGDDPIIVSVSLGAPRQFAMRSRLTEGGRLSHSWSLGHGDLLVMYGQSQRTWEHALKKTAKPVGPRINVTFRAVKA